MNIFGPISLVFLSGCNSNSKQTQEVANRGSQIVNQNASVENSFEDSNWKISSSNSNYWENTLIPGCRFSRLLTLQDDGTEPPEKMGIKKLGGKTYDIQSMRAGNIEKCRIYTSVESGTMFLVAFDFDAESEKCINEAEYFLAN